MILDRFKLDGKVALVTGPGTGLGMAMAIALAEAGADIVGLYRQHVDAARSAVLACGRQFVALQVDLLTATTDELRAVVTDGVTQIGRLDILVNNAGINRRAGVLDVALEDFDDILRVNLRSVFALSQVAAVQMRAQGGGKIINVASMTSYTGSFRVSAYSASKTAILGLTRAMANELAPFNIQVNAIAPGYMATSLTEALRTDPIAAPGINQRIPAGRWGTPEDVQGAVVLLASAASDYMVGTTVVVDGGYLSR